MKKFVLILCCSLGVLLGASHESFGARVEPLYDAEIRVPATAKAEEIGKAIKSALIERGWTIQREEEGIIESKILVRSHTAEIRIPFDKEVIRIKYVSSNHLLYSEGKGQRHIHRNYNKWIKSLERDISSKLALL